MVQTLYEASINYTPANVQTTKNISELGIVNLHNPIIDDKVKDKVTGAEKIQKVMVVNDVKYRVPAPVFEQIQKIIKTATAFNQQVKLVRITRTGQGQKDTRYTVDVVHDLKN